MLEGVLHNVVKSYHNFNCLRDVRRVMKVIKLFKGMPLIPFLGIQ